jgi:rare lipoprotein A
LRPRPMSRAAVMAGALSLVVTGAAEQRAEAQTAKLAGAGVAKKRLHVRAGRDAHVIGTVRPGTGGMTVSLQVRRRSDWRTLDRDRTTASGRYVLRERLRVPMSARARLRVGRVKRGIGRLTVYRWANASWYGPGLYGNPLGCGGTLYPGRLGVAHKTLPCGSKVTLRHRGRTVRVRVIDRGPYVAGREYDLTEATAQRLRFSGHGPILATR